MSTPTIIPPPGFQLEQDDSSAVQPPAGFQLENSASPEVKPPAGFQLEKPAPHLPTKPRPPRVASAGAAPVPKPVSTAQPQAPAPIQPDQPHLPTNLVRVSPLQNQPLSPEAAARQQKYREAERLYGPEVMAENQRHANFADPRVKWADEIAKAKEQGRIEGHSPFYSP